MKVRGGFKGLGLKEFEFQRKHSSKFPIVEGVVLVKRVTPISACCLVMLGLLCLGHIVVNKE